MSRGGLLRILFGIVRLDARHRVSGGDVSPLADHQGDFRPM
jgi:hypothetical protein